MKDVYYNVKGKVLDKEPKKGPYYSLFFLDCAGMNIRIYKEYAHSRRELAEVNYNRLYIEGEKDFRFANVEFRVGDYREYFENKKNINYTCMCAKIYKALADLPKSLVDTYIEYITRYVIKEQV